MFSSLLRNVQGKLIPSSFLQDNVNHCQALSLIHCCSGSVALNALDFCTNPLSLALEQSLLFFPNDVSPISLGGLCKLKAHRLSTLNLLMVEIHPECCFDWYLP